MTSASHCRRAVRVGLAAVGRTTGSIRAAVDSTMSEGSTGAAVDCVRNRFPVALVFGRADCLLGGILQQYNDV